jgi:hypothetical protein
MKSISLVILSLVSLCTVQAQVKFAGSTVKTELQNGNMATTTINVPSSTLSSSLIAVAVTEFQQNSVLSVMDMESQKPFTVAQSAQLNNGTKVALYYLTNAATGLHTIRVMTAAGNKTNLKIISSAYMGVDPVSPIAFSSVNKNTTKDHEPFLNINCLQDQMVVSAMAFEVPAVTIPGTQLIGASLLPASLNLESNYAASATGSVNMSWKYTSGADGYWATVGITLKPTVYAFIPGQLTSFTGKLNSNKVDLAWSTTFEYNVKTITIMRSQDNKTWKEVVTLQGNGNSSIQKQYEAVDRTIETGNYYYKLVYVSDEGKKISSSTVNVKVTADKKLAFGSMPNPFRNTLQVLLFAGSDKNIRMTLVNARGNVIATQNVKPENGFVKYTMNQTANIAPGIYFLHCQGENDMISTTIVKN